ncbi:hypothetical protein L9W80_09055, partial [Vibrio aestuarianus]|uniref:hypothetical protein n=1 Tax=Vibrio aestuarianus TaxID=28171 RepID=UPI00237C6DF2
MIVRRSPHLHILSEGGKNIAYHSLLGNAAIINQNVMNLLDNFYQEVDIIAYLKNQPHLKSTIKRLIELDFLNNNNEDIHYYWNKEIQDRVKVEPIFSEGIVFLVTSDCNLNCTYCIANEDHSFSGKMSYEVIKNTINNYIYIRGERGGKNINPV